MFLYSLPELSYDYGALAPHIAGEIMELHHGKHHATYVKALNDTLEKIDTGRDKGDFGAIVGLEKSLAFNLGGHIARSMFWWNLSPSGGDEPHGELAAAIDQQFGSFDGFRAYFTAAATFILGSGRALLSWDTLGGRLLVHQLHHQGADPAQPYPAGRPGHLGARVLPAVPQTSSRTT